MKIFDKIWKKKRKCLVCEEAEDKTFYRCPTPGCQFVYCRQCWEEIEVLILGEWAGGKGGTYMYNS